MPKENASSYCPVCGYLLAFIPWKESDGQDICSSCGIQFGEDDLGDSKKDDLIYLNWREAWIKNGMKWWSKSDDKPKNWNPKEQLKQISKGLQGL